MTQNLNPHERAELPRCNECGQELSENKYDWTCRNLECVECADFEKFTILDENGMNYGTGSFAEMRQEFSNLTAGAPLVPHWYMIISPITDDIYQDYQGGNEDKL